MSQFNGFDCFIGDLVNGAHNLHRDCLAVMLTNEQPKPSYGTRSQIKEIENAAGANPYGIQVLGIRSETNGAKFTLFGDDTCFTCSGDSFGPFRYAVLYNASSAANNLIGWWDYGASVTLVRGETFTVDFDEKHGILQIEGMPSTPAQGKTHREILAEELDAHDEPQYALMVREGQTSDDLMDAALAAMSRVSAPLVVTEEAKNAAWAAIVGCDIAEECGTAAIIKADLDVALTAALPHMSRGELTKADYEAAHAGTQALVRQIDVILNGDKAARQASLCDLIPQIEQLASRGDSELVEALSLLEQCYRALHEQYREEQASYDSPPEPADQWSYSVVSLFTAIQEITGKDHEALSRFDGGKK